MKGENDVSLKHYFKCYDVLMTEMKGLSIFERLTYMYYLSQWEGLKKVYVSDEILASKLGVSSRTILRARNRLIELGLISIREEKKGKPTIYQLEESKFNELFGVEFFKKENTSNQQDEDCPVSGLKRKIKKLN